MFAVFFALFMALSPASANASETDRAEYVRLSAELERLAERKAWGGVEKTYDAIESLGVETRHRDHLAAAHAAAHVGDVATTRERLVRANAIREDRAVIEWLWTIDTAYSVVSVQSDQGATLKPAATPFDPKQARAIEFAAAIVAESGAFEGYLPEGTYTVGGTRFEVEVGPEIGGDPLEIDARSAVPAKKRRR